MEEKVPPHDRKLEEIVLGSILLEGLNTAIKVLNILRVSTFYEPEHQYIYEAIRDMALANQPIDIYTVIQKLAENGCLEKVGGAYYVAHLTENVGSAPHIEYHARILVEKEVRRLMIAKSTEINRISFDESYDVTDSIAATSSFIEEIIAYFNVDNDNNKVGSIIESVIKSVEEAAAKGDGISGVSSGLPSIDNMTHGWQPSDMIVIAARPSMGKTAFAISMAQKMLEQGTSILFFTLEMSKEQITQRLLSIETEIPISNIKTGKLTSEEWNKMESVISKIQSLPLIIDDEPSLSTLSLIAKCKNYTKKYAIQAIIVDYIQLMQASGKNQNRENSVAEISRTMKLIAKSLNVPVFALSQLNRDVEKRQGDKRPQLSDLRESGAIEQDADIVCFIHRPEKYGIEITDDGESTEGLAQIIFAKHRNGELGDVSLHFQGECTKFKEWN